MALSDALVSLDGMTATFGGFGPTPQKDVSKTVEEVMAAYERMTRQREDRLAYFARQEELTSEERDFTDADGTTWHYVLFDQTEARITGFEADAPRVVVPSQIEGTPVFAILPDGCAHNHMVEEIVCADCIQTIGASAFRDSARLRRLVLPRFTAGFDRTWIQACPRLEELVLPGMLERVDAGVFENSGVKVLSVGINASEFAPGMFEKGNLDRIEIDEDNPHFVTDGEAVLSRDGREYVALAVNCRSYEVPTGVEHIAKKSFQGMNDLEEVVLPEGLETIGDYAFCRTALAELEVPDSVTTIGEHAFFKAKALRRIQLGGGIVSIGVDAFTDTALEELRIPASIRELAYPLVNHTGLVCAGNDATFTIAPDSEVLFFDEAGGLYRRADDGLHFVKMFAQDVVEYDILPSTTFIDAQAFFNYLTLEAVSIPDSVVEVGRAAFSGCKKLRAVRLGNSVKTIGMDAFLDTSLERLRIPASVESIGAKALITNGAHHGRQAPSLKSVTVDAGNERFYTVPGLLCERIDDSSSRIVLYTGEVASLTIPDDVTEIASYAFNGTRLLSELFISTHVSKISMCGLTVDCVIEHLHIDLEEPVEGHDSFDLHFPDTTRAAMEVSVALGSAYHLNLPEILRHYDNTIVNTYDIGTNTLSENLELYRQAQLIIERLKDPIYMTDSNKSMCDAFMEREACAICVDAARHDDRAMIDDLVALEYLTGDNIMQAIDEVGRLQDAAMTGYLLEIKRRHFGIGSLDFDL